MTEFIPDPEPVTEEMIKAAEDAILANVQPRIDEINAKLKEGVSFDELIREYGEDPGMQNEANRAEGYPVHESSILWDPAFTAAAMALEKVGDVSAPVISSSGVHIIRYESDVTPGAVALEDIHDALYNETLENLKTEHYNDELEAWVAALNPKYSIDAFKLSAEE